jgi:imidazoleglycerol phosphate dehydratase HisB
MSNLKRETKETHITANVRIGTGTAKVETGDQFLTHMVETLARYGGLDI